MLALARITAHEKLAIHVWRWNHVDVVNVIDTGHRNQVNYPQCL
jgi:Zn ribbon nucleic-acid-binding protein